MPIISKALIKNVKTTVDHLSGSNARKLRNAADVLKNAKGMGIPHIPDSSILRAKRLADVATSKSTDTRVKFGVGTVGTIVGGGVAAQAHHKHKENQILKRIDSMYNSQ